MSYRREKEIECTRELVEEVARRLATRTVRDSDLELISALTNNDNVAIVQQGVNKRVAMSDLADFLGKSFGLDVLIDNIERILDQCKIDCNTTEYWNNSEYLPPSGKVVIYSDKDFEIIDGKRVNIPGIKVGTGNAYVQDLPFVDKKLSDTLFSHMADNDIHVTRTDKDFWNNKLNVDDEYAVVDGVLIFNRN